MRSNLSSSSFANSWSNFKDLGSFSTSHLSNSVPTYILILLHFLSISDLRFFLAEAVRYGFGPLRFFDGESAIVAVYYNEHANDPSPVDFTELNYELLCSPQRYFIVLPFYNVACVDITKMVLTESS